jgi:hypothetical protein
MEPSVRAGLAFATVALLFTHGRAARAAEPTMAEALFREARDLIARGDLAAACPKLEESQRLDPAPGTEFNLARCYELQGRLASAWGAYADVAAITHAAGQGERELRARERVAAIEPRLSFLTVKRSAGEGAIALSWDGKPMALAELDVAIPVDPGAHVIRASAPGKRDWETTVRIDADAQRITIEVPPLADAPPVIAAPAAAVTEPPPSAWSGQRTAAVAALGASVVAGGVGAYFGLRKLSLASEARSRCDSTGCDPQGSTASHDSMFVGDASTVSFVVCGALAAAGGVLWLTAPKRPITVAPAVTASGGSVVLQGRWQ